MLSISRITRGSPASRAGLRRGDSIVSCDGSRITDWLDFCIHATGRKIGIDYRRSGISRRIELTRDPGVSWGIEFTGQKPAVCRRKCIFCFVDQQPPDLRPSLMVKDDDVLHSFFHGTYVTLDGDQVKTAISRRLTPIHVSVHAVDPDVRGMMLGVGKPAPVLPRLRELADSGIEVEAQVVVVPGINDCGVLGETAEALYRIGNVTSLGIVPVGLTDWREGLTPLRRPGPEECVAVLSLCDSFRSRALSERGVGWVYPADEFFLIAGRDIPPLSWYDERTLESNGIGLLSRMLLENRGRQRSGAGTVCTADLAWGTVSGVLEGSAYDVLRVDNGLFGDRVGVAGLLSGRDIVRRLAGTPRLRMPVYLPGVMFNHDMRTLDDLTPEDIERVTGMEIVVTQRLLGLP